MATTFGLEFEVQGVSVAQASELLNLAGITCFATGSGIHQTADSWKSVYDGSVSNGAEIVSPILTAPRLNEAVKVTKVLKANGARVDTATGFHVHIGGRIFGSAGALARFALNYYAIHHAIGALVAPSRLNNRYCHVLNRADAERQATYLENGGGASYNGNRYTSLNLDALDRHGTVEIRLHQGTLNGVKAVAWAQFVEALILESNKGVDFTGHENLNPWTHRPQYGSAPASVADCHTLLDFLTGTGSLNASAGDYLKNRAGKLHG